MPEPGAPKSVTAVFIVQRPAARPPERRRHHLPPPDCFL